MSDKKKQWVVLVGSTFLVCLSLYLIRLRFAYVLDYDSVARVTNGFRVGVFLDCIMILLAIPLAFLLNGIIRIPMSLVLIPYFSSIGFQVYRIFFITVFFKADFIGGLFLSKARTLFISPLL